MELTPNRGEGENERKIFIRCYFQYLRHFIYLYICSTYMDWKTDVIFGFSSCKLVIVNIVLIIWHKSFWFSLSLICSVFWLTVKMAVEKLEFDFLYEISISDFLYFASTFLLENRIFCLVWEVHKLFIKCHLFSDIIVVLTSTYHPKINTTGANNVVNPSTT